MAKRNEHLIVLMFDDAPEAKFEIWPLKLTIVPWFDCDDEQRLDKLLGQIAKKIKKFSITTGRLEVWGKKNQVEVIRIENSKPLHGLHWQIFRGLEKGGFPVHQKDFLGDKYQPHLTVRNRNQIVHREMPTGTKLEVNEFWLVQQERLKKSGRMIKSMKKAYELA